MTLHTSTRLPVDDTYVSLVGKAIYVFAYYEWSIIYIIEYLQSGFVHRYSRGAPMTSGLVKDAFQSTLGNPSVSFAKVSQMELQACCDEFERLIVTKKCVSYRTFYSAA
jgi:hypothetical protein